MNGQDQPIQELLRRRLDRVADISALTARTHKLIQETSGIEMEILRLQLTLDRDPGNHEAARELGEVEGQAAAIQLAQADCVAEIEAAEAAVMDIDRLITAAKGGQS